MAVTGEVVTPHGLLSKLHMLGALQRLLMKCEDDPVDQPRTKTSFCPFCSYHCHNDSTFLNHIVSFHYDVGYSCGKCVEEVFITSQSFKVHFKECDGLSCDFTDAGGSLHHSPCTLAKDESPCRRQEQPSKKASAKGDEHTPHQCIQAQKEEGPEEVAAHMCLYITITWFNKNISKTRSVCFYADRLASHTL